ncbi:universal stress protein [Salarchaeum sp. JOR-1]|uniref:universal stress protein n=1 Tax=Salarchaeum sp. JOR-1 TaxID=2599399 RepID=UPI0011986CB6|nr:universal stress protein [Salarchaeum sp. JOR-1]QDX41254.1 universal stress protein [Salarchaeum sp. JOR-1]
MTFLVAYDDSPLSRAALDRAVEFAGEQKVVVVTAIPRSPAYARANDWLDDDEAFDMDATEAMLRERVQERQPSVSFEPVRLEAAPPPATIGLAVRKAARQFDADVVFVGSRNAGRLVTNIVSVGQNVATDASYDVHIVRSS